VRSSTIPAGLYEGAASDIMTLLYLLRRDWHEEVDSMGSLIGQDVPPLAHLALASDALASNQRHQRVSQAFADNLNNPDFDAERILEQLLAHYRKQGYGDLARYDALCWQQQTLTGIAYPALPDMAQLIGLERQLSALRANTEAFLAGKPAQHTLLYGPRGSGKSTAIKSLLTRYREAGLRLVEVFPEHLPDLPRITEQLRPQPARFVIFVDDLSFDAGDSRYQPLKTLLEGSLSRRPDNVLVYATSNRRHLVTERLQDRPDPLDDDVHGWDTHNERLALADRFGLTLTFPSAGQREFLAIVYGLAIHANLTIDDGFEQRALQFAKWGNGLSGRVAQQFIDHERARV
jgi:predicted AAA+ superfamily ATPase